MSTKAISYVFYGIKLNYEDHIEFIRDYYENDLEIPNIIIDGMNGEYIVIGNILWNCDVYLKTSFSEINLNDLQNLEDVYKNNFKLKFPKYSEMVNQDFKIICFIHFS